MPHPVLYSFRRCPYAIRARLALAAGGKTVTLREVLLKDKPAHMLSLSAKGTVPVLLLPDGTVIDESLDIMAWALTTENPKTPANAVMLATDPAREQAMDTLIRENDTVFVPALNQYKYASRHKGADPLYHRDKGLAFIAKLDALLAGKAWLYGDRPSRADFAVLPFVRQYRMPDPAWFDGLDYKSVKNWLTAFVDSTFFQGVMEKHPPWKPSQKGLENQGE